jgi:hypothetical protein
MIPAPQFPWIETDAMFLLLVKRAAELRARSDACDEEELDCLVNVIDAYEAKRWQADALPSLS